MNANLNTYIYQPENQIAKENNNTSSANLTFEPSGVLPFPQLTKQLCNTTSKTSDNLNIGNCEIPLLTCPTIPKSDNDLSSVNCKVPPLTCPTVPQLDKGVSSDDYIKAKDKKPVKISHVKTVVINIGSDELKVEVEGDTIGDSMFLKIDADKKSIKEYLKSVNACQEAIKEGVTSMDIPEGITTIEDGAFSEALFTGRKVLDDGCVNMTAVTLPSTLKTIGRNAFCYCESLRKIEIPEEVITIGAGAFAVCKSLVSISIPKNVTTIEDQTFDCCRNLKEINIPEGVTTIGKWAFRNCESLTNIVLPATITMIDEGAFSGCKNLIIVEIQSDNMLTGENIFDKCEKLKSISNISNGTYMVLSNNNINIFFPAKRYSDSFRKLCTQMFPKSDFTIRFLNLDNNLCNASTKPD